jgi:hypothetical protein
VLDGFHGQHKSVCFCSSVIYTSTVGCAAAAPAMNSRENILNSLEPKKNKVNSECQCRVMNNIRRRVINSAKQS